MTTTSAADFRLLTARSTDKLFQDGSNLHTASEASTVYLDMAKGETESFQVVIVPDAANEVTGVKVTLNSPEMNGGRLTVSWNVVDYVRTGNPSYPVQKVGLWPDILSPPRDFSVAGATVQPLWIRVSAPADSAPGPYVGSVTVESGGKERKIEIRARVRKFTLPMPGTLAANFSIYAWTLSQHYHGTRDYRKAMPVETFANWVEFLAQYRIVAKNVGTDYRKETKKPNLYGGSEMTQVDLGEMKKTVGALAEKYFPPYSFEAFRFTSGFVVERDMRNQNPAILPQKYAGPGIMILKEWKKQGFPAQCYIYGFDEPHAKNRSLVDVLRRTYQVLKKEFPEVKIMQTLGGTAPELKGMVDIWCPKTSSAWDPFYQERRKAGDTLWQYVAVSPVPPYPNFCVDEPGLDHRILFWQTRKIGATGFLYWSTTWWTGFPKTIEEGEVDLRKHDMFSSKWQHNNGDGVLFYPGANMTPVPSQRLEIIRDGIEDYEYFSVLEKLVAQVGAISAYRKPDGEGVVKRARELLTVPDEITSGPLSYTRDFAKISSRREEIADMIEQLMDVLEAKDYETWNSKRELGE